MSWTNLTELDDLQVWLKADDISGPPADTAPIDSWTDHSGNSNHVIGSGTTRPLFDAVSLNGLPGVVFDGANDQLLSTARLKLLNQTGIIIVASTGTNKDYNGFVALHYVNTGTGWYPPACRGLLGKSTGRVLLSFGGTGGISISHRFIRYTNALTAGVAKIMSHLLAPVTADGMVRFDGLTLSSVDTSAMQVNELAVGGNPWLWLGYTGLGGGYLNGTINEVVIWNRKEVDSGATE